MSKKPVIVVGVGATKVARIALDLESAEQATELAKQIAEQTGKAVTVRDADGLPLETIRKPTKN